MKDDVVSSCPILFSGADYFPIECGDGWHDIIRELCEAIEAINQESEGSTRVLQIKEKYGGLRFYVGGATDDIFDLIEEAEKKSYHICEVCGDDGKLSHHNHWYKTLCPSCAKKGGFSYGLPNGDDVV
jgi:hypothetical protein